TLVVFGTAFFLYRLVLKVNPQEKLAAFFTGLFYLSAISFQSLSFGIGRGTGLEVNTEHLFLFFSVLGAYFLYARHQKVRNAALAGLALGLGFLIKYFVAFDMLALGLVLILLHWEEYRLKNWPSLLLLGLTFTACALLPFGLLNAWYYFGTDLWEVWVDITYNSGSNYSGESKGLPILKMLDAIGNVFYFSGIVSAAFIGLLVSWFRKKSPVKAPYLKGWLLWFVITLIAPMLPGKWFTHYFYQVFPAFSLLAGHFMAKALVNHEATVYRRGAILGLIMAVSLPVFGTMKYIFFFSKPDTPRQVVAYLKETVAPDRMVYCYSYYHVVNYLMGQLPPTKYYHPSLLFRKDHIAAMGIDEKAELDQIFAQEPVAVLYDCSNQDWYRLWMQGILVTPDTVFDDEAAIILWDQHQEEAALFKMVQEQKAVLPDSSSTKE
ncbi:MAG: glycosyltransferase family 39 protein, partial [Salibacteraceae bacterium]